MCERQRDRVVCVRERERQTGRKRECVCVREREKEKEKERVCVREKGSRDHGAALETGAQLTLRLLAEHIAG